MTENILGPVLPLFPFPLHFFPSTNYSKLSFILWGSFAVNFHIKKKEILYISWNILTSLQEIY